MIVHGITHSAATAHGVPHSILLVASGRAARHHSSVMRLLRRHVGRHPHVGHTSTRAGRVAMHLVWHVGMSHGLLRRRVQRRMSAIVSSTLRRWTSSRHGKAITRRLLRHLIGISTLHAGGNVPMHIGIPTVHVGIVHTGRGSTLMPGWHRRTRHGSRSNALLLLPRCRSIEGYHHLDLLFVSMRVRKSVMNK